MPEISVIIPCYNTKREWFITCIKSIINQSFHNFEIIIVDDGSADDYRNAYQEICSLDSRIQVYYKDNGGVSAARNFGVKHAKGKYIVFVDSDDFLVPRFLEEAHEVIRTEEADVVLGCNIHLQDYKKETSDNNLGSGEIVKLDRQRISEFKPYMVGKRLRFQNGLIYIGRGPWTRILRRELAVSTPFDTNLAICEDIVWNLQLINKSQKICYVKKAWYVYNMHPESTVRKYDPAAVDKAEAGLSSVKKCLDLSLDKEYKAFCDRCFEDMSRIYKTAFHTDKQILEDLAKRFYTEWTWNVVGEKRYWRLSNNRTKVKIVLFKTRMLFLMIRLLKNMHSAVKR